MLLKQVSIDFYSTNSIIKKSPNTRRPTVATHVYYLGMMKMQEVTPHPNQPFHHHASLGKGQIWGKETPGLLT
jgi:hypothetical protein